MTAGRGVTSNPRHHAAHYGFFYRTADEFVAGTSRFIRQGVEAGEPTVVAVPGARQSILRAELGSASGDVRFVDMAEVGRNPARIIPMLASVTAAHPNQRVHFVGQPIWHGRSPAEVDQCTRHEALLNEAFADVDIAMFCPYDTARLDPATIDDARRTHPLLVGTGTGVRVSDVYTSPAEIYARPAPLPEPPATARALTYGVGDLGAVRQLVRRSANLAGLSFARADDLLVAVNEVATNTLAHTYSYGELRMWAADGEFVCELSDTGHIVDPLVGRYPPSGDSEGGRGLWLVNQLCDLVQLRTSADGTTVRMHIRL